MAPPGRGIGTIHDDLYVDLHLHDNACVYIHGHCEVNCECKRCSFVSRFKSDLTLEFLHFQRTL
ncbi:MAG: hypothetical protein HYX74_11435 [Acidobacteria bacterium]|nr:hypothetical protein [Acidobacteriota bacterium]